MKKVILVIAILGTPGLSLPISNLVIGSPSATLAGAGEYKGKLL